jgi:hypothetical protein
MMRRCLWFVVALAAATPALGDSSQPPAEDAPGVCQADWMIDAARAGFTTGSPAYRNYLRALLKEAAPTLSIDTLLDAVAHERDPALLEALGAALASRASYEENPTLLERLFDRAVSDADPALRAAAVRALRATGSVETMAALGDAVSYDALVRDPAPEVRAAVADNLVAENRDVYGGRDTQVADAAAKVAAAAADPVIAGRVLTEISMERASAESIASITKALASDAPALRQGAALALGSAPPGAGETRKALVDRYVRESDISVRIAILQALARLGQASAIPTLRSLRGVAPEVDAEIDTWLEVLGLGLQEWHLILREKLKRTGGQPR